MRKSEPVLALAKLGVWASVRIGLATSTPSLANHWLVEAVAATLAYRV